MRLRNICCLWALFSPKTCKPVFACRSRLWTTRSSSGKYRSNRGVKIVCKNVKLANNKTRCQRQQFCAWSSSAYIYSYWHGAWPQTLYAAYHSSTYSLYLLHDQSRNKSPEQDRAGGIIQKQFSPGLFDAFHSKMLRASYYGVLRLKTL